MSFPSSPPSTLAQKLVARASGRDRVTPGETFDFYQEFGLKLPGFVTMDLLGVPRDVEPQAADLDDVFLYSVDELQVIVKDTSEAKAMGDAYDLADALDGADLSSPTGSYGFTSAALYTEPQEITPPEGGPYLWEFRIKATITIEKG